MRKCEPAAELSICFFATLCLFSIALNIALVAELKAPGILKTVRLALKNVPSVSPRDHVRGDALAPVVIIDYSDYQCPYSKQMHAELKKLISSSNRVKWITRNRPLESIHPLALKAAVAAECAGRQGAFWQYSDALFENQKSLEDSVFDNLARTLSLNLTEFAACRGSDVVSLIQSQISDAKALEIETTPTLFVQGRRSEGAMSYAELSNRINN